MLQAVLEFTLAIFAGVLAGAVGGGGGMLFVPILVFAGLAPVAAVATSNIGIFVTTAAATVSNARAGLVPWRRVLMIGIPAVVIAPAGAYVAHHLPGTALLLGFAALNVVNALLTNRRPADPAPGREDAIDPASTVQVAVTGGSGGFLAGLFGIGGGLITVPLQILWLRTPIKVAARVSLGVIVMSSGAALAGHLLNHADIDWTSGLLLGLGGLIGAPIGARLLRRMSPLAATRLLQSVLLGVAVLVAYKALAG
ncbi:MAG: sulfite exporter TauE/SafE family protein [Candidatus Nanopelagicales bacterium]|nr:sulfite exporter TauE/SafE family protein [Candidatus Nanopelagicales bacterium]